MEEASLHRSLARALDILELCGTCSIGFTLSQLSQQLHVPKSSIFPLVHTLQARNYLIFDPVTGRYRIGGMALQVGNCYLAGDTALCEIQRIMQELVDLYDVTCFLGKLKGGDVLYLKKVQSPDKFQMVAIEGRTLPAYSTGLGKALLMDHTLPMLKTLYYDGLYPLTPHTITDFYTLSNQLAQMRTEGFAHEEEESTPQVRCYAVPIRKDGRILAALSAAFPTSAYSQEKATKICSSLKRAQNNIEHLIRDVEPPF